MTKPVPPDSPSNQPVSEERVAIDMWQHLYDWQGYYTMMETLKCPMCVLTQTLKWRGSPCCQGCIRLEVRRWRLLGCVSTEHPITPTDYATIYQDY